MPLQILCLDKHCSRYRTSIPKLDVTDDILLCEFPQTKMFSSKTTILLIYTRNNYFPLFVKYFKFNSFFKKKRLNTF